MSIVDWSDPTEQPSGGRRVVRAGPAVGGEPEDGAADARRPSDGDDGRVWPQPDVEQMLTGAGDDAGPADDGSRLWSGFGGRVADAPVARSQPIASRRGARNQFVTATGAKRLRQGERERLLLAALSDDVIAGRLVESARATAFVNGKVTPLTFPQLAATDLLKLDHVRRPASHKKMPNIISLVPGTYRGVRYGMWAESRREARQWRSIMFEHPGVGVVTQPVLIEWNVGDLHVGHFPDALWEDPDSGARTLVDVTRRPEDQQLYKAAVLELTRRTALANGLAFEFRFPDPEQYAANLRHLAAFTNIPAELAAVADEVVAECGPPLSMGELCGLFIDVMFGDRPLGRGLALHCVAARKLDADLTKPITPRTAVTVFRGGAAPPEWVRRSCPVSW